MKKEAPTLKAENPKPTETFSHEKLFQPVCLLYFPRISCKITTSTLGMIQNPPPESREGVGGGGKKTQSQPAFVSESHQGRISAPQWKPSSFAPNPLKNNKSRKSHTSYKASLFSLSLSLSLTLLKKLCEKNCH
jgi:hypothetical protein